MYETEDLVLRSAERPSSAGFNTANVLVLGLGAVLMLSLSAVALAPERFAGFLLTGVDIDRTVHPVSRGAVRAISLLAGFSAVVCATAVVIGFRKRGSSKSGIAPLLRRDVLLLGRAEVAGLVVAVVGGALLRLGFLGQPIGFDEAISYVFFASRGLIDVVSDYAIPNNHIFHTILMHGAFAAGARSVEWLRMPAFLAGLALIPLTFLLAQRLFLRSHISLLAAALVAVSPAMVEYSVQARGYIIGTLFFVLAFIAITYVREQESLGAWCVFAVASALGLYTVPTMALGFGIPCVWLLLSVPRGERRRLALRAGTAMGTALLMTGILYAPVVIRSGWASLFSNSYVERLGWSELLVRNARNAALIGGCWTGSLPKVGALALGLAAGVPLVAHGRTRSLAWRIVAAVLLWLLLIVAVRQVAPPPRTLYFLFPLFATLAAAGSYVVYQKLRPRSRIEFIWIAFVVAVSTGWAVSRVARGGFEWFGNPASAEGASRANACAEPFYPDARPVIDRFADRIRGGALLVAYVYSGAVETTQFEALRRGLPPTSIRTIRDQDGIERIADARDVLVLIKPIRNGPALHTAYDLLHTDSASLARHYAPPELVASFSMTQVYSLRRLTPPDVESRSGRGRITYPR